MLSTVNNFERGDDFDRYPYFYDDTYSRKIVIDHRLNFDLRFTSEIKEKKAPLRGMQKYKLKRV